MNCNVEKVIRQLNKQLKISELQDEPINMNATELRVLEKLLDVIANKDDEEYDVTLDIEDNLSLPQENGDDGEDLDEFEDDKDPSPTSSEFSQPSGSEYAPTPSSRLNRPDDDYMAKAYNYWNKMPIDQPAVYITAESVEGGRRPFKSVQHTYYQLKSASQLYNYERSVLRRPSMKAINKRTYEIFQEKRAEGSFIHDRHLQLWALQVKKEIDPENIINFKASKSWVLKFKKRYGIVSRKITKHVTVGDIDKQHDIEKIAVEFASQVKEEMAEMQLAPNQVFNIDQSKFEKELHSRRTLEQKGKRDVTARVGSVYATKHSYCIMPIISMDGTLHRNLYVLVSEPSGAFPRNKSPDPANIRSFASKTSQMSKKDMEEFYSEVFWPTIKDSTPQQILLLLDSWSANKDENLFKSHIPQLKEASIRLIPPGTTGIIQPLDIYYFRPYKNFIKFITDSVILETNYHVWQREQFLKLQSLAHFQFTAERFKPIIQYAFFKSGYTSFCPEKCETPVDYCFKNVDSTCCFTENDEPDIMCNSLGFLRCAHCMQVFCLNHTLIDQLHIDCQE